MRLKHFLSRFSILTRLFLFIGYLMAIVYASLASPRQIPKLIYIPHIDKLVHLIMYLGFCFLGLWSMNTGLNNKGNNGFMSRTGFINYVIIYILAVGWGLLMEMMQRYMGIGRQYSVYDLYANITGALLGSLLYLIIVRNNKSLSRYQA